MQDKFNSHIFKGCCIAIIYIIFNSIVDFAKLHNAQWTDFVAWAIIIGGTLVSVQLFGKGNKNKLQFNVLFAHGFKTAAVTTCLIFIYVLLTVYVIHPSTIIEKANSIVAQAKKNNQFTDEKILLQTALKITRLITIAGTIMLTLFLGLLGAVLGAVISPKNIEQTN